jgi:CheY-like chemotaxis protein
MSLILLVDDAEDNIRPLQLVMGAAGHRVLSAENGEIGYGIASLEYPDLIVTDWDMPVLDGRGMCARLALHPILSQIPVVVVSAMEVVASPDIRWNAFLRKPVNPLQLIRLIASLLTGRIPVSTKLVDSMKTLSSRRPAVNPKCWP